MAQSKLNPHAATFVNISWDLKERLQYIAWEESIKATYYAFGPEAFQPGPAGLQQGFYQPVFHQEQYQYQYHPAAYPQAAYPQAAYPQNYYGTAGGHGTYKNWQGGSAAPKKVKDPASPPRQGRRSRVQTPLPAGVVTLPTSPVQPKVRSPPLNPAAAPFVPAALVELEAPNHGGADTAAGAASGHAPEAEVTVSAPSLPQEAPTATAAEVPQEVHPVPISSAPAAVLSPPCPSADSEDATYHALLESDKDTSEHMEVKKFGSAIAVSEVLCPATRTAIMSMAKKMGLRTASEEDAAGGSQIRVAYEDPVLADCLWRRIERALPKDMNGFYLEGLSTNVEIRCCSPQAAEVEAESVTLSNKNALVLNLCLKSDDDTVNISKDGKGLTISPGQAILCSSGFADAAFTPGLKCVMLRFTVKYGKPTWWARAKAAAGSSRNQLLMMGLAAGTAITAAGIIRSRQK